MNLKKYANIWMPVLVILLLVGATFANLRLSENFPMQDGFAPRYMAARQWMRAGSSPYSEETHLATLELLDEQGSRPGALDQGYFTDAAYFIYFYIPLSYIDYPVAKAIWMTLIELSYFMIGWLALKLSGLRVNGLETILICLLMLVFYPAFKSILSASILPPYLLLVIWACYLAINRQGMLAGVLLFIAFGMVPLSLVVAIFLMIWLGARRDSSLSNVYFVGLGFLVVTALILFPGWIPGWFGRLITLFSDFAWIDTPLSRAAAFFPGAIRQISIGLHLLLVIVLLVEWYGLGAKELRGFRWKLMLTLTVFYLFNPTSHGAYLLVLFPPLFTVFNYLVEKWRFSGKIFSWVIYLVLIFIYWTRFQTSPDWPSAESSDVILVLPFIVMIGLQWFRWWALVSPKALIDSRDLEENHHG